MTTLTKSSAEGRDLILTRLIEAPPEKVYKAWTDPELMKQWFAPLPWTNTKVEHDLRPGGSSLMVMRSQEGAEFPNRGVYREVVPNKRLVFTDAYTEAWQPSEKPFMTVGITFDDWGGKTNYPAHVRHGSVADREAHEKMGFHTGWAQCAEQPAALTARM